MLSTESSPKLRVSEVYLSIQGEGPRVGEPTVFIRFAGCNLRCPGWPCDTPHAIDPKIFTKDSEFLSPEQILQKVIDVASDGANICFTGGEPFLQNNTGLYNLSKLLSTNGYTTQEVFTNGTFEFAEWAYEELYFIMDWKLTGSGEGFSVDANKVRYKNVEDMNDGDVVKFTIASEDDYVQARTYADWFINPNIEIYYGVVWGKLEPSELIGWVLRDKLTDWTYTHQLHNVIWDRSKRGI